jgi:hypothetical protein
LDHGAGSAGRRRPRPLSCAGVNSEGGESHRPVEMFAFKTSFGKCKLFDHSQIQPLP